MSETKKHEFKKWEVSIMEFENTIGSKFKVTRKIPELGISETKVFSSKKRSKGSIR